MGCTKCGYERDSACRWLWDIEWISCEEDGEVKDTHLISRFEMGDGRGEEVLIAIRIARETGNRKMLREVEWNCGDLDGDSDDDEDRAQNEDEEEKRLEDMDGNLSKLAIRTTE